MKKAIAVVLGAAALAVATGSFGWDRDDEAVDPAKVDAVIDARLHQLLSRMLAERGATARR